ncbi:hypothetical protein HDK77DRAFT_453709 [Phyllosticta capitalensis]|uniref:tRNA 4-demethylwyosine synthase (AdoMet-dependent) n=1 Tax=Phyllosticta capitalensis TaxID=121624 RepID=A0ABR1YQN5_9PEZI
MPAMSSLESLQALPDELLGLWHTSRVPVLVVAFTVLFLLRLVQYLRTPNRQKLSATPIPGSPSRKVEDIAAKWIETETVPHLSEKSSKSLEDDHVEDITIAKPSLARTKGPKKVVGNKLPKPTRRPAPTFDPAQEKVQPLVFFATLGGTTEAAAKKLVDELGAWIDASDAEHRILKPEIHDLSEIDFDDFFISAPKGKNVKYFYFVVIPTYYIDTCLDNFLEHLQETHHDFRIDTAPLSGILGYSVFSFGDKEGWPTEEEGFCNQGKDVDKWLARLTDRKRAFPLGTGDVQSDAQERFKEWRLGVQEVLLDISAGKGLGEGVPGSGDPMESDEEDLEDEDGEEQSQSRKPKKSKKSTLDDVEDLGRMVQKDSSEENSSPDSEPMEVDFTTYSKKPKAAETSAPKEMVPSSSPTYAALTKQGYTIVGSHSGVKICRWTKSALRGRGSCYKYSFYGIRSHLCMETTPSLSCSNKCVFCWRHGTNPVGTTWRWVVDPPEKIFDGVTQGHYKKIKMMRGVPGVRAERFAEAMRIRHCALSLVGEPIFYPYINEFTDLLHKDHISSFLVCNAQHPAQLATLKPVTQLYVSIDASNKESLRKVDRPLNRDFWERFCACLDILREKRNRQRTVFRLTLVKGFNMADEIRGYADLVERGLPGFVEIKGVTYCGTSTSASAGLTMQNVPFYEEVQEFVTSLNEELARRGLEYGIAAEHAHSCCILLASTRFRKQVDGEWKWCTLIDYDRFFELLESGREFSPEEYMGEPTPEWALWGNGGFNPEDERHFRKGKKEKAQLDAGDAKPVIEI